MYCIGSKLMTSSLFAQPSYSRNLNKSKPFQLPKA